MAERTGLERLGRKWNEPWPFLRHRGKACRCRECLIRRVVAASGERLARIRFLPACVEIMLVVGSLDEARARAVN